MKLVIDFDSTIAQTHNAVLELYRSITSDMSTEVDDNNLQWDMKNVCPKWNQDEINNVFVDKRLFDFMKPMDDAVEVLQRLKDKGFYLEICSLHKEEGKAHKEQWIKDNLPMIDKITILPMSDTSKKFDKSVVKGDIIIDDRIDALTSSKCRFKICYGKYTWNKDWDGMRVTTWLDLENGINSIKMAEDRGWQ